MFQISFKNRLLAIALTVFFSLLATTGLFIAIKNLTNSLNSFETVKPDNAVISFELFSPLLASIKNNQPTSDFYTINSTLEKVINGLSQGKLANQPLNKLIGSQGHVALHFTNNGDITLVTNKNNRFNEEIRKSEALTYSKQINNVIIYSNNQNLLDNLLTDLNINKNILISFNDLAKITIANKIFDTSLTLSPELQQVKNVLMPLSSENSSFSARIQQSNHRTKIQFTNLNNSNNQATDSIDSLISLFPLNANEGFISNFSSSTLNLINSLNSKAIINDFLEPNTPILYSVDKNNHWVIGLISQDSSKIEKLVAVFSNLYDINFKTSVLPDGSLAKEIVINSPKLLEWNRTIPNNLNWEVKVNKANNLAIANKENIYIAGQLDLVNNLIKSGGYFPKDCQIESASNIVVSQKNQKKVYYSENSNKNAIFCIFE